MNDRRIEASDFKRLEGESFEARLGERSHTLRLVKVEVGTRGGAGPGRETPFSLLFEAPEGISRASHSGVFIHSEVGEVPMLVTPVIASGDGGETGVYLEAVFN